MGPFRHRLVVALLSASLAGCLDTHACRNDQAIVLAAVRERAGTPFVPDAVQLADGLSEGEAVHLALYNNAAFQELLTDLGAAHADVVEAGLLTNPELLYTFPAEGKPYRYLVDIPVEVLWLRPHRVDAATAEWERARERLTQAGLDLARDARVAFADWALAHERVRVAEESLRIRGRIATLTEDRRAAGEATPLEVSTAQIDQLRAAQELRRATNDLPIFEERLRNLLGLGAFRPDLAPEVTDPPADTGLDVAALAAEAMTTRPDVRAAERAVEAADARLRLAHLSWFRLLAIEDATAGDTGHVPSPGFRVTIPVFNWNQGAIGRAEAERERAARSVRTVRERVIQEVRQARALHAQAAADYRQWTQEIRPAVETAIRRAEATYKEGGATLVLVLETSRQLVEARAREAQLRADLIKAWAELERAVGRRLPPGSGFAAER